jgi:type II secretory pathway predicted ATPase ExeA
MSAPNVVTSSTLLSLYGLKWDPFSPGLPVEGVLSSARTESFVRRCQTYLREGGFAMVTGLPGVGKSVTMRVIDDRLSHMRDVMVRSIAHPQSRLTDFYRELGDLFGVSLSAHNRWGGFKSIRDKWQAHIDATLIKPVLIIDEAQEMLTSVLSELRLLTSRDYDSRTLLFVILAGDARLLDKLKSDELLPLRSRIRTHLALEASTPGELADCLRHLLDAAGNAHLMTPAVVLALAEHAAGNHRSMMMMGQELLAAAAERDARQIDESLFFDIFALPSGPQASTPKAKRR